MVTTQRGDQVSMNVLDPEECMVLLRWEVIGRLAVSIPDRAPSVVPVNFVVDHGTIVFRTGEGEKHDHLIGQPVSFQADRFDWYRRIGWSVLVKGVAVIDVGSSEQLELLAVEPWAPGAMDRVVRIEPTSITGRRLVLAESTVDLRGYL
jgi:nitroimidazol reductase NimA-like FMN-containing flavoprotein (pyridoxamine 5'-phosphate oxidase superfamily)